MLRIVFFTLFCFVIYIFFFFNDTATTEIYTLSLHDALPISIQLDSCSMEQETSSSQTASTTGCWNTTRRRGRSEEHTSELQSHLNLVCRLLLEKKKKNIDNKNKHI